jgi:hypothetical protein
MDAEIRALIERKRDEYKTVYMETLATANANHGAMQALDDLLIELDKRGTEAVTNDGND